MSKQFFSTLKVLALALALSFGLSYALAWTAPSVPPPNGNTDAPINVGATPQTKIGGDICTTVSGTTKCLQTVSGGTGAGDNLGNHTATTSLNMAGFNVNNAANLINTSATAQTKLGALSVGGEIDATGGTGTSYSTAPIEVRTTLTPRLAFHWPGVVASQIGMDSAGTIRTYDNPGTGYANFTAAGITATNRLTVSEAGGAYTYITLRDDDSPSGVKYIHANGNHIGFLNSLGGWSSYWDNSNNQILYGSLRSYGYLVSPRGVFSNGQVTCTGGITYNTSSNYTCYSPYVITADGITHPVGRYPYTDDNLGVVSMRGVCAATGGSMSSAAVRVDGGWQTIFTLSGGTFWSSVTGINLTSVTCSY